MGTRHIIETSRTLKEALTRQGLKPSFYQREKLKRLIEQNGWRINSKIDYDRPLGTTGVWATIMPSQFEQIIRDSECWTQVLRALNLGQKGSTATTAHKYAKLLKVDTSHFKGKSVQGRMTKRIPNKDLFVENSNSRTSIVRNRVLCEKLIDYVCGECNQEPIHNGKPLTLQLDHINGSSRDHRLANLMFLCPNCHTQTKTWGRKTKILVDIYDPIL